MDSVDKPNLPPVVLPAIQYLRAIAAIAVVIEHAAGMAAMEKYFGHKVIFYDFLTKGSLGVNLFFVISGFIIVVSSLEMTSMKAKKTFKDFCLARFTRIIPMMWLAIVSYAFLRFLGRGGGYDLMPYINAFFLIPFGDYDPNNIWTLRHEFIFYIIFALSFLLGYKKFLPLIIFWVLFPIFSNLVINDSLSRLEEVINNIFHIANPLFGIGVLIGLVYVRFPIYFHMFGTQISEKLRSWQFLIVYFLSTVIIGAWGDYGFHNPQSVLFSVVMYLPLVLIATLNIDKPNRIMMYFGNASFAIYLFHPHIESALLGIIATLKPSLQIELVVTVVTVVTVVATCCIYTLVEIPLSRFIHKNITGRNKRVEGEIEVPRN